jgi:hypothetical protein
VAKAGTRFTRNPLEPRPAEESTGSQDRPEQETVDGADGGPSAPEAEEFRAQWDAENAATQERSDDLVSMD